MALPTNYSYKQAGNFHVTAHPTLPNIYGQGDVEIDGDCTIRGRLIVSGPVTTSKETSLKKSATQTIPNATYTTLTDWQVEPIGFDDNNFNLTAGTFTATVDCRVQLSVIAKWENIDNSGLRRVQLFLNNVGTYFLQDSQPCSDDTIPTTQTFLCFLKVSTGDVLEIKVYQDSDVSLNVMDDTTLFVVIQ